MIETDLFEIENARILGGISLGNKRNIEASIKADSNGIYISPFGEKLKITEIIYSEKYHSRQRIILPYEDFLFIGKPYQIKEKLPGIYKKGNYLWIAESRKIISEENRTIKNILERLFK